MSGQHRATPSDWFQVEQVARIGSSDCSAILELRARVEALEATQHAHADLSRLSDAEREQMAQELAKPAAWRPLEVETTYGNEPAADAAQILLAPMVVEGTFEHGGGTYRFKASAERPTAMDELRAASAEARPSGLVQGVAGAIHPDICADPNLYLHEARAAIRKVAAAAKDLRFTTAKALIAWLERESQ